MIASRKEQNKINSKERILKASRRLFSYKGYDETMMEEIANFAEVSKATLYNYFPNKASLLTGIVKEQMDNVLEIVENRKDEYKDSDAMIRAILEEIILASADYSDLARRITYLSSNKESVLFGAYEEIESLFTKLVDQAKKEGIFDKKSDSEEIADVIFSIYLISQFRWNHIGRYTHEQIREKINRYYNGLMARYYI